MTCSIKSGSNWLHRLRTSRGFPVEAGLDLEHFLNSTSDPNPNANPNLGEIQFESPNAAKKEANPEISAFDSVELPSRSVAHPNSEQNEDWFDLMTNALAEIFNMGGGSKDLSRVRALKSSRKQPNPKICVVSSSASAQDSCLPGALIPAMSPCSADNSVAKAKNTRIDGGLGLVTVEDDEDFHMAGFDSDLHSYSQFTVTVIDTSSPTWKSEKLVFRKGDVWKFRDRKWRSGKKSWKKRKFEKSSKLICCGEHEKEEHLLLSSEGHTQGGTGEVCKESPTEKTQSSKKRSKLKAMKGGASKEQLAAPVIKFRSPKGGKFS